MDKNEFRELMIGVLKMQIDAITEKPDYDENEYLQGQETGLLIAIEKLKAAEFLTTGSRA